VSSRLAFVKMSGAGNDFVLVDNRDGRIREKAKAALARAVCPRRTSVGADGLILLERPRSPDAGVRMRILNPDGSEAEMCGNGARCLAHFARSVGAAGDDIMEIETPAGVVSARVTGATVKVGLTRPGEAASRGVLRFADREGEVFFVDTGVPHAVVFFESVDATDADDIRRWGRALRRHEAFRPAGANADFAAVAGPGRLTLRTYERGVEDETLACGTGATAAALVAAWREEWPSPVEVRVRSGETLRVHFAGGGPRYDSASLEGDVKATFEGAVDLEGLQGLEARAPEEGP
jgi:diaminopimelate epimerase